MKPARHKPNHWLPWLVSKAMGYTVVAVTLGRTVYWRWGVLPAFVKHEEEHVRQFQRLGWWGFLSRYLREYRAGRRRGLSKKQAYLNISLEREARAANPFEAP